MERNLFSGYGSTPLTYPHYTKWGGQQVIIVTSPDVLIEVGDTIVCETKNQVLEKPKKVLSIIQQRTARGKHNTGFTPVMQKLEVEDYS